MMTKIKQSIFVVLALILSGSLHAATFLLLTEQLPPYSMKKGSQVTGASIDIVSTLFTRAGLDYKISILPWKRAVVTSKTESNACVFPMQRNQEREAFYQWISPVLITHTGFYTREDSPHKLVTINDAKGLKIGTYRGSAVAEYLSSWGYDVKLTPRDEPNVKKLEQQRIDVWAADTLSSRYLAGINKITDIKEQLVYFTTLRALACNVKVPEDVIERLQNELKAMYVDGTIEKIMAGYQ